ncbi:hypothetical protein QOT17_018219 [Balamuthia mandrillaris]
MSYLECKSSVVIVEELDPLLLPREACVDPSVETIPSNSSFTTIRASSSLTDEEPEKDRETHELQWLCEEPQQSNQRSSTSLFIDLVEDEDDETVTHLKERIDLEKEKDLEILCSTSPSARPPRALQMLDSLTPELIAQLTAACSRWSPSTLRKHAWAHLIWRGYCSRYGWPDFPLNPSVHHPGSFVEWLVKHVKYALSSVIDVIMASLYRIHQEKTGKEVPREIRDRVQRAAQKCKREFPKCQQRQAKRDACLRDDVIHIIATTPLGKVSRAAEASCWLHSAYTGARAITAANIRLDDIRELRPNAEQEGKYFLKLRHQVTKGVPSGYIHSPPSMTNTSTTDINSGIIGDFVYWLALHLQSKHDLCLQDLAQWNLTEEQRQTFLWGWDRDALNMRLRSRAKAAGYPPYLFSFHSLRAGFLCSALIKEGLNNLNTRVDVLNKTAMVAGWVPNGRSQHRYVKDTLKRAIVCTHLVTPAGSTSDIDAQLITKEAFHELSTPLQSQWFKQRQDLSSFQNQKLCNALWYCCSNDWVRTHEEELQEELQKEARDYELRNEGPVRWNNVNKIVARRHIASLLSGNYDLLKELVDEFTAPVDKTLEEGSPIKQVATRKRRKDGSDLKQCIEAKRIKLQGSNHRSRLPWKEQETKRLVRLHLEEGASWIDIAQQLPEQRRTNVDCKDKWRNLLQKLGSVENIRAKYLKPRKE